MKNLNLSNKPCSEFTALSWPDCKLIVVTQVPLYPLRKLDKTTTNLNTLEYRILFRFKGDLCLVICPKLTRYCKSIIVTQVPFIL